MTDREELIEEAAKAIDPPAWTGGIAHDPRWVDEAEARRISAMRQARAALSVFEQAHTPTVDEREALFRALDGFVSDGIDHRDAVDAVFAAGFSRTVQGEPTGHDRDRDGICRRCGHGLTAAEVLDGETPCEPQGEPSDATDFFVDAVESWFDEYNGTDPGVGGWYALEVNIDAARAALRAAAATQEGGNR